MNDLLTFTSIAEFKSHRAKLTSRVGLVPTMGALHAGHASLIQQCAEKNDVTIVTIYVNPTQFNNADDLNKYPKTFEADLELAQKAGAQIILAPTYEEIYPDGYTYKVTESEFSKTLCGSHRPGHFDGVLTIVLKLLQITDADTAYFGEKDFQQFKLIEKMSSAFFLKTKIKSCSTLREADGLAMSSRNVRLTAPGREKAPLIYKALTTAPTAAKARQILENENIQVEYLEDHDRRRFVAAFIDQVRLIDNVKI